MNPAAVQALTEDMQRLLDLVSAEPLPYAPGNGVTGCPTYRQHADHLIAEARRTSRRRALANRNRHETI